MKLIQSFDKAKNEISYVPRFNIESGLNKIINLSGKKFYRHWKMMLACVQPSYLA